MIIESFYVIASAILFSFPLGYALSKVPKFRLLVNKEEKEKLKVISDPNLLLKKIKENGEIIDDGDVLDINVEVKDGVETGSLTIDRTPVYVEPPKKDPVKSPSKKKPKVKTAKKNSKKKV